MNAIITGATKGIGKAIAEHFAAEGFNLAVCSRSEADLEAFKNEFLEKYPKIQILTKATDMSVKGQVVDFADFIKREWNEVEVLVNNAGLFVPGEISTLR